MLKIWPYCFKKLKSSASIILSLFLLVSVTFSQLVPECFSKTNINTSTSANLKELDQQISKSVEMYNFSGSILVSKKGTTLFSKGFGMADKNKKIPNSPSTKFLIGSMTKQFTAVAIMQLQEKGLLNVNDYVSKYIPNLPNGNKITLSQVLTHTSGLPREMPISLLVTKLPKTYHEALKIICSKNFSPLFKPGTDWSYSNLGYQLLGYIIEKVSKKTYADYLKDNIFKPLKMNNSGFGYNRSINKDLAIGYDPLGKAFDMNEYFSRYVGNDGAIIKFNTNEFLSNFTVSPGAAGGIYSTTGDLAIWDRALYTEKVLSKKSLDKIFTPVFDYYGYGWFISGKGSAKLVWHGGTVYDFQTEIQRWIGKDTCVIVLSNVDDYDAVRDVSLDISAIVNNN